MARNIGDLVTSTLGGAVSVAAVAGGAAAVHYASDYVARGDARFFGSYAAVFMCSVLAVQGPSLVRATAESINGFVQIYRSYSRKSTAVSEVAH